MMEKSFFVSNNNDNLEIETIDDDTTSISKQNTIINLLTKLLIISLIFAGSAVLVTIIIVLVFVYINCSRPSRIHKQIPIEYLDSSEMINYLVDTPTSSISEQ
jgi:ABC-type Fe3+ transport system permease subunit